MGAGDEQPVRLEPFGLEPFGLEPIGQEAAGSRRQAGAIRTEREFMDALRALKARSGLSYRDIAQRMFRVAPRDAVSKTTLADLFGQDRLPRRPGTLSALVHVLTGAANEPAEVTSGYLQAWSRLVAARSGGNRKPVDRHAIHPTPSSGPASHPTSTRTEVATFLPWLLLLSVISFVFDGFLPSGAVPFWLVWIMFCWPLLIPLLLFLARALLPRSKI